MATSRWGLTCPGEPSDTYRIVKPLHGSLQGHDQESMGKPVWETLFTPHGLSKYKDADKFFLFVVTNL